MKAYISGPMTGIPEFNYPAFRKAAWALRAQGVEVISPHEVNPQDGAEHPWEWYLRRNIIALMEADVIVVLPGFLSSKGSQLECYIGAALSMPVYELADVLESGAAVARVVGL